MTLKEIREKSGYTQGEISKKTGINIPVISNYESANILPTLEDAVILQKTFSEKIDWQDNFKPQIENEINILMNHFPTTSVINFLARYCRKDLQYGVSIIKHYAQLAKELDQKPLLPPEVRRTIVKPL